MTNSGVSVIICCHNSAKNLPCTIEALAKQNLTNSFRWEIIVVDNNSTDNTRHVAISEWSKYNITDISFQVVEEKSPGLSAAREKGFQVSSYEFCLFCDDDNWLNRNYVASVFELMKNDPTVGVLGGMGEAVCEETPPSWFDDLKSGYAIGKQAESSGDVTDRGYVYGAGATFRKSVYLALRKKGFQPLLSDRKGKVLSSGGDKELCYAYVLLGFRIYYSSQLQFEHFIASHKLSKDYATKMFIGFAAAQPVLNLYEYAIKGSQTGKSSIGLRLMWIKDMLYTLFLIGRFANRGLLNLRMLIAVLKKLFSLRGKYHELYLRIQALKN
jgi:glycosyltransferase involved in cell wall biosynthesis